MKEGEFFGLDVCCFVCAIILIKFFKCTTMVVCDDSYIVCYRYSLPDYVPNIV